MQSESLCKALINYKPFIVLRATFFSPFYLSDFLREDLSACWVLTGWWNETAIGLGTSGISYWSERNPWSEDRIGAERKGALAVPRPRVNTQGHRARWVCVTLKTCHASSILSTSEHKSKNDSRTLRLAYYLLKCSCMYMSVNKKVTLSLESEKFSGVLESFYQESALEPLSRSALSLPAQIEFNLHDTPSQGRPCVSGGFCCVTCVRKQFLMILIF